MHPVVELPHLEHVLDSAQERELLSRDIRIEDADLDIGMRREGPDLRAAVDSERIVEQDANADSTVRGGEQRAQQQLPRFVLLEDEVLHVERLLRLLRDLHAQREAFRAVRQQAEPGKPGMLFRTRSEALAERGGLGLGQRARFRFRRIEPRRHRRAPRHEQRRSED